MNNEECNTLDEKQTSFEQISDSKYHEVFFGLVCPVGTEKKKLVENLKNSLSRVQYKSDRIKLTDLLYHVKGLTLKDKTSISRDEYIQNRMDLGDQLRRTTKDGSALVKLAFGEIAELRTENSFENHPQPKHAYIFDSLKHPKEIEVLKKVYGKNIWIISAYSPEKTRQEYLANEIKHDKHGLSSEEYLESARKLIQRDKEDPKDAFGQQIIKTFHYGDLFVDVNDAKLNDAIERFVNLVFNDVDPTPTTEEIGMFYAKASSFRSASLARQVGAAIIAKNGDVLATGTNEVPNYGGGLCGPDHNPDQRESNMGSDSNTVTTVNLLHEFVSKLKDSGWLSESKNNQNVDELVKNIREDSTLKNVRIMDATEYGREVHAEMAALMNASRQTISVDGSTLYCTTFPCHVCVKHIIASGIIGVIYIEPYPKSLAKDLFGGKNGLINVDENEKNGSVLIKPFVGISPSRFMELFAWKEKKNEDGTKIIWDAEKAQLRYWGDPRQIINNEKVNGNNLVEKLSATNLSL